jgi:hypothetical protein
MISQFLANKFINHIIISSYIKSFFIFWVIRSIRVLKVRNRTRTHTLKYSTYRNRTRTRKPEETDNSVYLGSVQVRVLDLKCLPYQRQRRCRDELQIAMPSASEWRLRRHRRLSKMDELEACLVPSLSRRHQPHFSRHNCGGQFGRRNLGVACGATHQTRSRLSHMKDNANPQQKATPARVTIAGAFAQNILQHIATKPRVARRLSPKPRLPEPLVATAMPPNECRAPSTPNRLAT